MWSNMLIHVWCPFHVCMLSCKSCRFDGWGIWKSIYTHTHINTYSNYIFISLLVYCVHNYFPYCCYVWQWYGLSYFPCKFIPINEFLYAHKINAKPMWTWSFRQVTGLSRLALLWTEYKVTWAFEGDEMTGATRASLRGLRMTAVSDHENACYCNISKEAHQHTSCWKNSEHWWEICSFSSVLTLSLSQEMAVFPFWPAENMPKHLTRLRASVVGADILLWRSDAHCMLCDRGAEGLGHPSGANCTFLVFQYLIPMWKLNKMSLILLKFPDRLCINVLISIKIYVIMVFWWFCTCMHEGERLEVFWFRNSRPKFHIKK